MGQVNSSKLIVTTEDDWIAVVLDDDLAELAIKQGSLQEDQSKHRKLNDRSIDQDPGRSLRCSIGSKRAEYAVHQYFDRVPRVTLPGEFHDWPDVGQCNVRFMGDPEDNLCIQDNDQGELPMILATSKDKSFKDKTIWLIGWGMTDLLRKNFVLINQFRENKNWGIIAGIQPHEQFFYPRKYLNPMKTLSKEFMNTPFK